MVNGSSSPKLPGLILGGVILAAGILTALGSLFIVLGSLLQAMLAYYQLTTSKLKEPENAAEALTQLVAIIAAL
jgi:hypothetical protein